MNELQEARAAATRWVNELRVAEWVEKAVRGAEAAEGNAREAEQRRDAAAAQLQAAEERLAQVKRETEVFEKSLAESRSKALKEAAEQERVIKQKADAILAEAQRRADDAIGQMHNQLDALSAERDALVRDVEDLKNTKAMAEKALAAIKSKL